MHSSVFGLLDNTCLLCNAHTCHMLMTLVQLLPLNHETIAEQALRNTDKLVSTISFKEHGILIPIPKSMKCSYIVYMLDMLPLKPPASVATQNHMQPPLATGPKCYPLPPTLLHRLTGLGSTFQCSRGARPLLLSSPQGA